MEQETRGGRRVWWEVVVLSVMVTLLILAIPIVALVDTLHRHDELVAHGYRGRGRRTWSGQVSPRSSGRSTAISSCCSRRAACASN